jgi:hypothetical protein
VGAWFGGPALIRLKNAKGTELHVAQARSQELKKKLGSEEVRPPADYFFRNACRF